MTNKKESENMTKLPDIEVVNVNVTPMKIFQNVRFQTLEDFNISLSKVKPPILYYFIDGSSRSIGYLHQGIMHYFMIGRFRSFDEWKDAQERGFGNSEREYQQAIQFGIQDNKEYREICDMGFTPNEAKDWKNAKKGGFCDQEEYQKAKNDGYSNLKEWHDFQAAKKNGFKNYKDFERAKKMGFASGIKYYPALKMKCPDRKAYLKIKNSGFKKWDDFIMAQEIGIDNHDSLKAYEFLSKIRIGLPVMINRISKKTGISEDTLEKILAKDPAIQKLGEFDASSGNFIRKEPESDFEYSIDIHNFEFKNAVIDGNNVAYGSNEDVPRLKNILSMKEEIENLDFIRIPRCLQRG